ncbi:hypothetical protein EJB05_40817, partial [Eragrostis curvula]
MSTWRRLPPALPEELVEEIVLRFPPDDPAGLLSASLVCKSWCRVISGTDFHRRFREHHRTPPLLGIIHSSVGISFGRGGCIKQTQFMPASTFLLNTANMSRWCAIDTLHGRILFGDYDSTELFVWSPAPGEVRRLPALLPLGKYSWSAALLCATAGCNHLDCSGAFVVVFVGTYIVKVTTSAYIYSSEQHEWSTPIYMQDRSVQGIKRPSARVGNTVYFICKRSTKLLAYELCKRELSFVSIPSTCWSYSFTVFATADEGRLGFATAEWFRLFTWSREAGSLDGDAGWTQQRVFEIDKLLPSSTLSYQYDLFATTNNGVIVVKGNSVLFAIDLKSGEVKKLLDGSAVRSISDVVPYIGFCTPTSSHQYKFA